MTPAAFSRRGFLTRAAAGAMGLLGGSFVGGLTTRAWAHPLTHLRAGQRPVIDRPRSVIPIGLEEAQRRERRALQIPEVRTLVRELTSSGYRKVGEPVGVDGVAGWMTEGGKAVSLRFVKDGSDKATASIDARWWDQRREVPACDDAMPDFYSKEVIRGAAGTPSVLRFRYVNESGGLDVREETFDANSAAAIECQPDCHAHTNPPGPCPLGCPGACVHCRGYTNVCSGQPPDCSACTPCLLCIPWQCGAPCAVICAALCSTLGEKYCCDYYDSVCCPPDYSQLPHNFYECVPL